LAKPRPRPRPKEQSTQEHKKLVACAAALKHTLNMTNGTVTTSRFLLTSKHNRTSHDGYLATVWAPSAAVAIHGLINTRGYTYYTPDSIEAEELPNRRDDNGRVMSDFEMLLGFC
jgi:hypothetical protein